MKPTHFVIYGQGCQQHPLNPPPATLHTDLAKTYQRPYAGLIANYDELAALARAHGYVEEV